MDCFKGKVCIVTGSSSGIGAETAVQFASHGAKIVLTARRHDKLLETASKCRAAGASDADILVLAGDVTKEEDIKHIVKTTVVRFGSIHVLVNNAGSAIKGRIENTSVNDLDTMNNVNVRSVYMMTLEVLPHLIATKGSIVNVSSAAGSRPSNYYLPYAMTKATVDQFTKCVALDLAPKGVRVNAVNPATIVTDIFTKPGSAVSDLKDLEQFLSKMAVCHPMGRVGQPEEVARAILWLASDQASFTTGICLPIDGGRSNTTWHPDQPRIE